MILLPINAWLKPVSFTNQGKEMIELYFDFRLYRLWKTRQHSKLLDYEDFLWRRNLNTGCSGALQCHEEPDKTDPTTEHCSTVVLDLSTQYKQLYLLSSGRGLGEEEEGWRDKEAEDKTRISCASAPRHFQSQRLKNTKRAEKHT